MARKYPGKFEPTPEFIENQGKLARNPLAWRLRAMSLQRSAELLQEQSWIDWGRRIWKEVVFVPFGTGAIESPYVPRLDSVVVLLQTFAVHSLLTAMCIDRDGALAESARTFDALETHTPLELCDQLDIDLNSSECDMLDGMESVLRSAPRRPIPLVHYAVHPKPIPGNPTPFGSHSLLELNIRKAAEFLERLWKLYEEITPVPEQLR